MHIKLIGTIPAYLVQGFSDRGMYETSTDKDDLRIVAELSGGHCVFVGINQHLAFSDNGDLLILVYSED